MDIHEATALMPLRSEGYKSFDDIRFVRLRKWTFLRAQLNEAKIFINLIDRKTTDTKDKTTNSVLTQQAFFRSFIVVYAKCFTSAAKGRAALDNKNVFKQADESIEKAHNRIMELRHKFVAHSDISNIEIAKIAHKETKNDVKLKGVYLIRIPLDELGSFMSTIEHVLTFVTEKYKSDADNIGKVINKNIEI